MQVTQRETGYDLWIFDEGEEYDRSDLLDSGWIAELIGLGGPYRFERRFLKNHDSGNWYGLQEGRLYEYRELYCGGSKYAHNKYGGARGFFRIIQGQIEDLDEGTVIDLLKKPDAAMLAALEANKAEIEKRQAERQREQIRHLAEQLEQFGETQVAEVIGHRRLARWLSKAYEQRATAAGDEPSDSSFAPHSL